MIPGTPLISNLFLTDANSSANRLVIYHNTSDKGHIEVYDPHDDLIYITSGMTLMTMDRSLIPKPGDIILKDWKEFVPNDYYLITLSYSVLLKPHEDSGIDEIESNSGSREIVEEAIQKYQLCIRST